ncbi:MAG: hypothetical protein EPN33_05220 [Acidobacteria bacterium]|nr:MAG: hypothetical protein EPN33_05220 [Acidobacteriota bacterium]
MDVPSLPLTLCAHARLAHSLRAAYDERQRAAGRQSWPTAPIFTLDAWLERLWATGGDRMLLTNLQEQLLWHQIIAAHAAGRELLDLDATAAAAADAWRLAQHWNLPLTGEACQEREETAAFSVWAEEFQRACRRQEWITTAGLPATIAARLPAAALPAAMQWVGFDELSPQLHELVSALRTAGVSVDVATPSAEPVCPEVTQFSDPGAELQAVAAWARNLVEQNPAAHIGVVVPGLAAHRSTVERIFLEVFHPRRPPWDDAPRAFHLSLGPPLAEAPAIAAALQLVELFSTRGLVESSAALAWIRSPFLAGSETETAARARLEQEIRGQQRELWRWYDLARLTARHGPALAASLRRARAVVRRWPQRQAHQPWAESWAALWESLGWPGERPVESAGWQTIAAWQRLLDDFGRLDQVAPAPVDSAAALTRLRRAAAARPLQPQAAPAPVQILGWLEASGLEFTHLWICGLDEQTLPAPPHPHPFLPLALQRERNLPHASAAREAEVAQRLWQRLLCSSPDVQASFAASDGEGRPQLPSPLLAGLPLRHSPAVLPATQTADQETLDDHLAPPATEPERRAGSGLFLDQSACPFRAFAHQRLHARAAPALAVGLPATVRGALLHRVLCDLWAGPDAGDFSAARIERLAAAAVAAERRLAGRPGLAATEGARLAAAVLAWCAIERQRRPFHVLATEDCLTAAFAGLELHLRRDRIDELEDGSAMGSLVLLDYKSGECSTGAWAGPYPEQPQLPLYLVTEPRRAQVAAITFAQVRSGDMALVGVERSPGTLLSEPFAHPKWMLSWEDQRARWDRELHALAEEYLRGEARVEPRQRTSCEHCDLHALCRIRERRAPDPGEEEEADAAAG